MKYRVTNRLEQSLHFGKIEFLPKETKILNVKPNSDRFIIEEIAEKAEEIKKSKGGNKHDNIR